MAKVNEVLHLVSPRLASGTIDQIPTYPHRFGTRLPLPVLALAVSKTPPLKLRLGICVDVTGRPVLTDPWSYVLDP